MKERDPSKTGCLSPGTGGVWGRRTLLRGQPWALRRFSGTQPLPPEATNTPSPGGYHQNCCPCPLGRETESPRWRSAGLDPWGEGRRRPRRPERTATKASRFRPTGSPGWAPALAFRVKNWGMNERMQNRAGGGAVSVRCGAGPSLTLELLSPGPAGRDVKCHVSDSPGEQSQPLRGRSRSVCHSCRGRPPPVLCADVTRVNLRRFCRGRLRGEATREKRPATASGKEHAPGPGPRGPRTQTRRGPSTRTCRGRWWRRARGWPLGAAGEGPALGTLRRPVFADLALGPVAT